MAILREIEGDLDCASIILCSLLRRCAALVEKVLSSLVINVPLGVVLDR